MPTPDFKPLNVPEDKSTDEKIQRLEDAYIRMIRDLNYILENLDDININRLDAKVIIAGTITAAKIAAGAITANEIAAGTITADKLSVSQLSAIAADLGTITAGIIYGAYIATANGTVPRIELSSSTNLLEAFASLTDSIFIDPVTGGKVQLGFENSTTEVIIQAPAGIFLIATALAAGEIQISSGEDLRLSAQGDTYVDSWSELINNATGNTLQSDLDAKQDTLTGYTGSVTVVTSVDFGASTTTTSTLNYTDGVLTSVT